MGTHSLLRLNLVQYSVKKASPAIMTVKESEVVSAAQPAAAAARRTVAGDAAVHHDVKRAKTLGAVPLPPAFRLERYFAKVWYHAAVVLELVCV